VFLCSFDKVDYKQEVRFLLYLLGQIVTWQFNSLIKIDHELYTWSLLTVAELTITIYLTYYTLAVEHKGMFVVYVYCLCKLKSDYGTWHYAVLL